MSHHIKAFVASGSLIDIDQCAWVELALSRSLNWEEIAESRVEAGHFFQADFEAEIHVDEVEKAATAIAAARCYHNDSR